MVLFVVTFSYNLSYNDRYQQKSLITKVSIIKYLNAISFFLFLSVFHFFSLLSLYYYYQYHYKYSKKNLIREIFYFFNGDKRLLTNISKLKIKWKTLKNDDSTLAKRHYQIKEILLVAVYKYGKNSR